jgi:hypothetical protein
MLGSWAAWARTHKPATVVLSVLVLAVAAGVAVAAWGSGGGGTAAKAPFSGSATPGAGAAATEPPQPAVTKGAKWLTGPAGKLLDTVTADVGRINADQRAGKARAARVEGTRLAADALAALRGPMPPVDGSLYRSALRDFEQAGTDTASGKFGAAGALVAPASLRIATVTAAANPAQPVGSPA